MATNSGTIFPRPSILKLTLPDDPVRQSQLRRKLDEYQFRLKLPLYDYVQTACKVAVLQKLLQDTVVDPVALFAELSTNPEQHIDIGAFYNAFAVIENYCRTGGASAIGGTGLPKVR